MTSRLLAWLDEPRPTAGVHVAAARDDWEHVTYPELAAVVRRTAALLRPAISAPREPPHHLPPVVLLLFPGGVPFLAGFFGSLAAGAVASPVVPPSPVAQSRDEYVAHLVNRIRLADPAVVACEPTYAAIAGAARDAAGSRCAILELDANTIRSAPGGDATTSPPPWPLLQFTSGSTGEPSGVSISWENIEANLDAFTGWVGWQPSDSVVSWLPPHHDMGLVGSLLGSLAMQTDLWLMRPDQFIRAPERWLACLGDGRATLTAAPTFGYAFAAERVRAGALAGADFSRWRVALVGAEPIRAEPLERFGAALAGRGFRLEAFHPGYGLAEATLCVTGQQPTGERPSVARLDGPVTLGGPVAVTTGRLGDGLAGDAGTVLCTSGRPTGDARVVVVDERGEDVDEGVAGEVTVAGRSVGRPVATGSIGAAPDPLHTGDAGFVVDGDLFVIGRLHTSTKIRGETVFAEDLESRLGRIDGLARARSVIVFPPGPAPEVVLVTDARPGPWTGQASRELRRIAGAGGTARIMTLTRGSIPLTPSGKPRRLELWSSIVAGIADVEEVAGW